MLIIDSQVHAYEASTPKRPVSLPVLKFMSLPLESVAIPAANTYINNVPEKPGGDI